MDACWLEPVHLPPLSCLFGLQPPYKGGEVRGEDEVKKIGAGGKSLRQADNTVNRFYVD